MLINAVELENFKGISSRVRIDLRPITLLFGANSAGKSTILQALHYARELLARRNTDPDRTEYGGDRIDLGGFRNLVYEHDVSRRITIKLHLTLDGLGLPDLTPDPWEEWQADLSGEPEQVWRFHNTIQETREAAVNASVTIVVGWSEVTRNAVVLTYEAGINDEWFARIEASEDGRDVSIRFNSFNPIFVRKYSEEEKERFDALRTDLLSWINVVDVGEVPPITESAAMDEEEVEFDDLSKAIPGTTDHFTIFPEILVVARDAGLDKPGEGLRSWLSGFDSALPRFSQLLSIPAGRKGGSSNIYICRDFTAFLSALTIGPGKLACEALNKLRYLGPIREVPDRGYRPALTISESRWASGLGAWDWIYRASSDVLQQLNEWLADPDRLATSYRLTVKRFKEIDAGSPMMVSLLDPTAILENLDSLRQELLRISERSRLIITEAGTGLELSPQDIGIGISQVIPVIVAALDGAGRLTAIEQPELHIHPALQIALGDLFIEAVEGVGSPAAEASFIIETHSEHLLLRLLSRLRQTSEGQQPFGLGLTPDKIAVHFVEDGEQGTVIRALPLDERGNFTERWPNGFFDERERELFGNTTPLSEEDFARMLGR